MTINADLAGLLSRMPNTALVLSAALGIYANGSFGSAGQVLTSNGTSTYWANGGGGGGAGVNVDSAYAWTNTHTWGNSSVNSIVNATTFQSGSMIANSSGFYYGATAIGSGSVVLGNTTVNTVVNSTVHSWNNDLFLSRSGPNALQLGTADLAAVTTATVTLSNVANSVLTYTSHNMVANQAFMLTTSGALPTGVTAQIPLYVAVVINTTAFTFSTVPGGANVNASGTQSGTHTIWVAPAPKIIAAQGIANAISNNIPGTYTYLRGSPGSGNAAGGGFVFQTYSGGSTGNVVPSPTSVLTIAPTGNVGVKNTNPADTFHVQGNIIASGDITTAYSDIRLKDIVGKLDDPLGKLMLLDAFIYVPSDLGKQLNPDVALEPKIGLSAQKVQELFPEVVSLAAFDRLPGGGSVSGQNYLTMSYDRLVPVLIESQKQMMALINKLEARVEELEEQIEGL